MPTYEKKGSSFLQGMKPKVGTSLVSQLHLFSLNAVHI